MADPYNFQRFVDAQQGVIDIAIAEIRAGSKQSHWMWFIFPQLAELGRSPTAKFYGIGSLDEARAYLAHPLLGHRLRQSIDVVLAWGDRRQACDIFGEIDALKLRSSLTLFDRAAPGETFFTGIKSFFGGQRDERTLALLNGER
jgi:uncharacterized protein (DUF1810 family)